MREILKIAIMDMKLLFRDKSLRAFLVLPLVIYALFLFLLPWLADKYVFLAPYLYLFVILGTIENTQTFCFISSMVLLDEKESGVAKTYGVIPLAGYQFVLSRILFPFLITTLINFIFLLVQPFFSIGLISNLLISLLLSLVVPLYVLTLNLFAKTRVEGLVFVKAFNIVVLIPIASFFMPQFLEYIFSFIPTFWAFQSLNFIIENNSFWAPMIFGFGLYFTLIFIVAKQFLKKHFL
ncbi:hypothetical protein C0584_03585 [Candidatus Parcubacteria bacterium]|nr:MAG: hypothetical protein C0584_03585 [Candidatus Parcubacteria bacterium]